MTLCRISAGAEEINVVVVNTDNFCDIPRALCEKNSSTSLVFLKEKHIHTFIYKYSYVTIRMDCVARQHLTTDAPSHELAHRGCEPGNVSPVHRRVSFWLYDDVITVAWYRPRFTDLHPTVRIGLFRVLGIGLEQKQSLLVQMRIRCHIFLHKVTACTQFTTYATYYVIKCVW